MLFSPRLRRYWNSIRHDKKIIASWKSIVRPAAGLLILCIGLYLLWLPFSYLFAASSSPAPRHRQPITALPSGEDALRHFAGGKECSILQSDIYAAPYSPNPKLSPFCSNRATLLEALSNGGRYGYDEPYVGKGCTYRWFGTAEICMVLERFNAIVFLGDDIARTIYLGLNILLREDLAFGGIQGWSMNEQDRAACRCDDQFTEDCVAYGIGSSEEVKRNAEKASSYYCERIPHAYIPVDTTPASASSINAFKDLTYLKPTPWQPSPVIFSFGHASSFSVDTTTRALEEWLALASAAERNIPLLFLSPPAIGSPDSNTAVWQFHRRMSTMLKHSHVDMLGLYNLTLQASSLERGLHFGERVALVEAMMIVNWLSKLETS